MKKLNIFAGVACALAFIVAAVLVALKKFPAVTVEECDELNQYTLLWILVAVGLNFFVYKAKFSPMLDRFYDAARILAVVCGASAVGSYFYEYQCDSMEGRFFFLSSLILGGMTLALYFMVRHFDDDVR